MSPTLLLLLTAAPPANGFLDVPLIGAHFSGKSVQFGTAYSCAPRIARLNALKVLSSGLRIPMEVKPMDEDCAFAAQKNVRRAGVFVDADCPNFGDFMRTCGASFDSRHHWLAAVSPGNETQLLTALRQLDLNVNSNFQYARGSKGDEILAIFDAYSVSHGKGAPLNVTGIGYYHGNGGFQLFGNRSNVYEERRDFGGLRFRSIVVLPEKFQGTAEDHVRSDLRVQINHFNRLHSLLNIYCGEFFNFTIDIESTDSWGYMQPNGSYDGIVGGLQKRTIDFGGSPIFLVKERFHLVDYGRRTWRLRSAFVFRHPKQKAAFQVFLRPLDALVWAAILVAMATVALVLKFVVRYEARIHAGLGSNREMEANWSSMVLLIVGALCQQGSPHVPAFISGRIVTIFVFIFSVLLYQFYSGSVVSFLLLQPPKTMNTIRDLAFSDLRIGCEDILYTRQYFKQLFQDKEMTRMKRRTYKANGAFYIHPELGLELVGRGGFAYHVDLATAYAIIDKSFPEEAVCELEEIPFFEARPVMSSFPKGSPFRDAFNHCFQKMAERGILHRQTKHYHARKPDCIRSRVPTSPVGLDEFYPAMVIMAIGAILSLTVLILEHITHIHCEKIAADHVFPVTD